MCLRFYNSLFMLYEICQKLKTLKSFSIKTLYLYKSSTLQDYPVKFVKSLKH